MAALRRRLLAAFRRPSGFRRLAAGVVCTGLHQAFVLLLLLAGAFADDPLTLMAVGFVAGTVLLLNVLLHTCPLSVMEEEKWGCSMATAGSAAAGWLLARDPSDAYSAQLQFVLVCCVAFVVRLMLLLAPRFVDRALDAIRLSVVPGQRV